MEIRLLRSNDIETRVQSVKKTSKSVGCILLLYKDSRCDMKILDETFGMLGWEREHQLINGNLFCTVRVWDKEKAMWISKQDVGTESNTEKEKGQASDSFKRACFNLGIGRELYTSPFIWINLNEGEWYEKEDRGQKKYFVSAGIKFHVKSIAYNDEKEIISLEILDNKGNSRYKLGNSNKTNIEPTGAKNSQKGSVGIDSAKVETIKAIAIKKGVSEDYICKYRNCKKFEELTLEGFTAAMDWLKKQPNKEMI